MKKILLRLVLFLMIIVIAISGYLGFRGYNGYKELTDQTSIETLVAQVESDPEFVAYEDLPSYLVRATVSIEDRRFFEHDGVDIIGLGRAVLSQFIPSLIQKSGGSTITQQVAKNLYGLFESNLDRKLVEFFLAKELEDKYSKNEIFALYVNIINYGDGYIGIYEASTGYFGVEPSSLTIAQCTILAGLPQSPSNYQLSDHYENAKNRQRQVLNAMIESSYITEDEADTIYATDIYVY